MLVRLVCRLDAVPDGPSSHGPFARA